jgi:thioesterase domain-containing protein
MAGEYLQALRGVQPRGPYLLGGWSLGGVVAFELARQLRQQGEEVALLALIDSAVPDTGTPPPDDVAALAGFARDLGDMFGKPLPISVDELCRMEAHMRLDYVLAQARHHAVVPPDVNPEWMHRLAHVFQANLRALQRYRPARAPQRITLLQAGEPLVAGQRPDLVAGWRSLASGVDVYVVPGNHYSMLRPPHVRAIADRLRACLEAAQMEQ